MTAPSTNARAGFLIVLLAALFTYGLIHVFSLRFATGEVYPEYSSLRASPGGAKLLYDSLSQTPGVVASRNYFPLEYLEETHATIFLLALHAGEFAADPEPYLDSVERLAGRGNRVVTALDWRATRSRGTPKSSTNAGASSSASTPTNRIRTACISPTLPNGACWTAMARKSWPSSATSRRAAWCCSPGAAISAMRPP